MAPTDLAIVPDIDTQIRSVLEARKKDIILSKDAALARTQSRIKDTLSPFTRGWKSVEDKKTNKYLGMSALLLGQSILHLSHQRRLNILSGLFGFARVKKLLKEHQSDFQK